MSQESLRYVRLDDLGLWLPPEIKADEHLAGLFRTTFENLEQLQAKMTDYLGFEGETEEAHYRRFIMTVLDPGVKLDPFDERINLSYLGAENEEAYRKWAESNPAKKPIADFAVKKAYTSAMRRLAPDGLATSIGFTGNFRAWRHILAMRSSPHAEVEMRAAMIPLAVKLREQFPAVFQDMDIKYKGALVPLSKDVTSEFLGPFCSDLTEHAEENFVDYEVSFKYPKV
jgi:thymidylate synthase ThyX